MRHIGSKKKCIPYYRIFIENQIIFPYNSHKNVKYTFFQSISFFYSKNDRDFYLIYVSTYESLGVHIEKMTN